MAHTLLDAVTAHPGAGPAFTAPALCAVAGLHRAARDRLDGVTGDLGLEDALAVAGGQALLQGRHPGPARSRSATAPSRDVTRSEARLR